MSRVSVVGAFALGLLMATLGGCSHSGRDTTASTEDAAAVDGSSKVPDAVVQSAAEVVCGQLKRTDGCEAEWAASDCKEQVGDSKAVVVFNPSGYTVFLKKSDYGDWVSDVAVLFGGECYQDVTPMNSMRDIPHPFVWFHPGIQSNTPATALMSNSDIEQAKTWDKMQDQQVEEGAKISKQVEEEAKHLNDPPYRLPSVKTYSEKSTFPSGTVASQDAYPAPSSSMSVQSNTSPPPDTTTSTPAGSLPLSSSVPSTSPVNGSADAAPQDNNSQPPDASSTTGNGALF